MARPMRAIVSITLLVVLLGGGLAVAVYLVATREPPAETTRSKAIPRVFAPAIEAVINQPVRIRGFGTARAKVRTDVAPLVGGRVIEVAENFRTGRYVGKRQVLLRIDPNDYQLALEAAQKQLALHEAQLATLAQDEANLKAVREIEAERLKLAESQLDKARRLLRSGAASEDEVDIAQDKLLAQKRQLQNVRDQISLIAPRRTELEAMVDTDQVQIRKARLELDRTVVKTREAARVISRRVEVDETVAPSAVCGEIYATELIEVPVSVPAEELRWLCPRVLGRSTEGMTDDPNAFDAEVRAVTINGEGTTWLGRINRIEAELDQATRTATVVVWVRNPAPGSDRPQLELNTYCEVTLLGRSVEKAFYLPRAAVLPGQEVFLIDTPVDDANTPRGADEADAGRLVRRKIEVARFAAEQAMVLPAGGLRQGDRVVQEYLARPVLGQSMIALERRDEAADSASTDPAATSTPPSAEGR